MKALIFLSSCLFLSTFIYSQKIYNEIIIKGTKSFANLQQYPKPDRLATAPVEHKIISEDLKLTFLKYNHDLSNDDLILIKKAFNAEAVFYNEFLEKRENPNDEFYEKQWALEFAKIHKVWPVTTGGKTNDKVEIVIGILDDGVDIFHPDLKNNIYSNKFEIAGDNKDNDFNGYLDDYNGYNVDSNDGTVIGKDHGTSVSGIMAASANNAIGISGVNWNVKILPVFGVNKLDEILTGYNYLLKMRRLYNNTNGSRGALIVTTNYSGGIKEVFATEEPYKTWCEMYDALGNEGIISVGATDNENINVALVGDMPSTCLSEFFISTTNLGPDGKKIFRAGFSDKFVTMAAPGENLVTLLPGEKYEQEFSGTSAAAPMVAGTIALLYSVPCAPFANLVNSDKVAAAKSVRDAILKGVTKTGPLTTQTVSGGYLNAENALALMDEPCENQLILPSPKGNLSILDIQKVGLEYQVKYLTPDDGIYTMMVSDMVGNVFYREAFDAPETGDKIFVLDNSILLRGMMAVTIYNEEGTASKLYFFPLK